MQIITSLNKLTSSENSLDKLAYAIHEENFSYRDVLSSAENIRHFLKTNGISKPVIVFGHKQVGMLSSFIGCNAAGVAFIPVDISTPKERIEHIIKLSEAQLIISISPLTFEPTCKVFNYDNLIDRKSTHSLCLDNYVSGEDVSYIIFTSGSTGVPKGVKISMEALDDFVEWSRSLVEDASSFSFVNHALFSFDLSIFEVWTAISLQGKIVALDHKNNSNIRASYELMQKEKCSIWVSTPSFMDMCLIDTKYSELTLPDLTHFVFCGEILSKATALKLKSKFPNSKIFNLYGPTEATCATTAIEITENVLAEYDILPVGYVKPNTQIYIDEKNNNEVIIVGKNVSHGYVNDSEKTKSQFFQSNGVRAYRTGDCGYFNEENILFVKGRIDRQIKFRGFRIELEEIESALRTALNISNAICLPVIKEEKVHALVAVLPSQVNINHKDLIEKLRPILPEYMIPTKLRFLDQMPLNNNGKIDKKEIEKLLAEKNG